MKIQKCFEDWKKRWNKCIISSSDYFKEGKIDSLVNKHFLKKYKIRDNEQTSYLPE